MVFGPNGNLYVPAFNSNEIIVFNGLSGNAVKTITDSFYKVTGLAHRKDGTLFAISDNVGFAKPVISEAPFR